jgi:glycosyltransferase involved in cell wall biosynthesis
VFSDSAKLKIVYPHNQKFMLRRAHDVLVMKTCHALASLGHEVYLLMGKTAAEERILAYYGLKPLPTLHLIQLPIFRWEGKLRLSWHGVFNYFCQKALLRIDRQIAADLVYLSEIKLGQYLLPQKSKIHLPFIYEVHGLYAIGYRQANPEEAYVFRNSDALITTTESLQTLMQTLYAPLPPFYKVPLATDLYDGIGGFVPPEPGKPWRLGYIGQLYPLQGVDLIIRALARLPDWIELDIVGGKQAHIEGLRELVHTCDLDRRVHFHGFVPPAEVPLWARQMHVLIVPSLPAGKMPYVAHTKVYEYLAMGRPVVAADLPSIREEIQDGYNGALFKAGDVGSLVEKILKIVSERSLAAAMAERARA